MLARTVLVVFALVLAASAKPARTRSDYSDYGAVFRLPFFRSPAFDDEFQSEESVSSPDYSEVPLGPHVPAGQFSSLGAMLDGIFNRMREQFDRLPTPSFSVPKFPSFGFNPAGFGLPKEPGNSSSTTTVVGDHVVTVNETVYHKDDGGIKSVFRIKVIDVSPNQDKTEKRPAKEPSSTVSAPVEEIVEVDLPAEKFDTTPVEKEETAPVEKVDATPAESSPETGMSMASTEISNEEFDNEIPSQNGESVLETIKRWNKQLIEERSRNAPDDEVEIIPAAETPIDLSGDLRVNQIMRDQMKGGLFMPDPDTEFIEVDDQGKLVPDMQEI